jgi:UDP-N-acetylglucosamine 2-epimerase
MNQKTYLFCISTPLEIVKTMPVYRALKEAGNQVSILQTGFQDADVRALHQSFDMPPDTTLECPAQPPQQFPTSALLDKINETLAQFKPDVVIVEGGSATAVAAAMAAYAQGIPVAHVDAGVRSYPEYPSYLEKNQELVARLAHWHFTATEQAKCNLLEERIAPTRIFEVGSTLIDAAIWTREHLHASSPGHAHSFSGDLREFLFQSRSRRLILVATDCPGTAPQVLADIAQALSENIAKHADCLVIWVTHSTLRARVEIALKKLHPSEHERIYLAGSLPFPSLVDLAARCGFVLTDSDNIEQMVSAFGKPVLIVADDHAGHQDLIKAGGALFTGTRLPGISTALETMLQDASALRAMQLQASPFGDGSAAGRIADILSIVK